MDVGNYFCIRVTSAELLLFQTNIDAFWERFRASLNLIGGTMDGPDASSEEIMKLSGFTLSVLGILDHLYVALFFAHHQLTVVPGLGEINYHSPEEVQKLVEILTRFEEERLTEHLSFMRPQFPNQDTPGFETLEEYQLFWFHTLKAFFQEAARSDDAIAVMIY